MAERGTETHWGEAGSCDWCDAVMRAGEPDACIGWVDGVREACCGHGTTSSAYVILDHGGVLSGKPALLFLGLASWPSRPPVSVPLLRPKPDDAPAQHRG